MNPSIVSPQATEILCQLAQTYGFDLTNSRRKIYLSLEQEGYNRLVLEKNEPHVISLSHYYKQNGDLMSNPDVTFFTQSDGNRLLLYPLTFTQSNLGIYQEVAELNNERDCLIKYYPLAMKDLTDFCSTWLVNLKAQHWFLDNLQPNPQITSNV